MLDETTLKKNPALRRALKQARKRYDRSAVVYLMKGACAGCGQTPPTSFLSRRVLVCEGCGRLIINSRVVPVTSL